MNTVFVTVMLCILMIFPGSLIASGMLEIAELQSNAEQYDKQKVSVSGKVTKIRTAKTGKGKFVYGFLLERGNSMVKVVGFGKPPVQEGEEVMVEGIFQRFRRGRNNPLLNEIKASLIRTLDRLHPDLVG